MALTILSLVSFLLKLSFGKRWKHVCCARRKTSQSKNVDWAVCILTQCKKVHTRHSYKICKELICLYLHEASGENLIPGLFSLKWCKLHIGGNTSWTNRFLTSQKNYLFQAWWNYRMLPNSTVWLHFVTLKHYYYWYAAFIFRKQFHTLNRCYAAAGLQKL